MPIRRLLTALAAGMAACSAAAFAQPVQLVTPGHWGGPFGQWYGGWQPEYVVTVPNQPTAPASAAWPGGYDRDGWLRECRHRLGIESARGAVAPARPGELDRCEAMLSAAAAQPALYAVPVMLVPAVAAAGPVQVGSPTPAPRACKETVVTEEFYEAVPRRQRHILRRSAPDKRVPQ